MNQSEALSVVRSLANGVDPESGEVFPADSVYQRSQTVRALYAAAAALEKQEKMERKKAQLPAKTGEPWTEDEDRKLLSGFDAGRGLPEIAVGACAASQLHARAAAETKTIHAEGGAIQIQNSSNIKNKDSARSAVPCRHRDRVTQRGT